MAKNNVKGILELSGSELCFAGQVNGIPQLLLPKDPFQGYLVEEIAQELQKAREQLIEKGWLSEDKEGQQSLSPELKKAVEILGSPERSLILQQEHKDGTSYVVYFHQKKKAWIEIKNVGDGYQIDRIENKKVLQDRLGNVFELTKGKKEADLSAKLKYEDYLQAQEISREEGLSASKKYLIKIGLDTEAIDNLAEDLSKPVTSGSATEWGWSRKDIQKRKGLAFLSGKERVWLVKENSKKPEWIDIILSTPGDLKKETQKLA